MRPFILLTLNPSLDPDYVPNNFTERGNFIENGGKSKILE